jgi:hypothetical protein
MKDTLFPEIEQEIRDDRKAARRALVQHARQYLKTRDFSWLINRLLDKGPATEHSLLLELMEEEHSLENGAKQVGLLLNDLLALWRVGKLWRRSLGIHPGSGQKSFLWGLRKVHESK